MKHTVVCFGGAILVVVLAAATIQAQVTGSGTAGKVPIWAGTPGTNSTTLGNSVITQASGGAVGVQAGGFNAFRAFSQTCIPTCMPLAGTAGVFGTGTGGTILQGANTSTNAVVFDLDSSGNLTIAGKLTKGSGAFKIDHPLDPANKYLSHSFVESPDMMDIYNGNVTTDERGWATIVLPDYFEVLNRDFRYQHPPWDSSRRQSWQRKLRTTVLRFGPTSPE